MASKNFLDLHLPLINLIPILKKALDVAYSENVNVDDSAKGSLDDHGNWSTKYHPVDSSKVAEGMSNPPIVVSQQIWLSSKRVNLFRADNKLSQDLTRESIYHSIRDCNEILKTLCLCILWKKTTF